MNTLRLHSAAVLLLVAACGCAGTVDPDDVGHEAPDATSADAHLDMDSHVDDSGADAVAMDAVTEADGSPLDAPAASDATNDAASDPDAFASDDAYSADARSEPCSTDGAMRRLRCECFAFRTEICRGGVWVVDSPCSYDCAPGSTRSVDETIVCAVYHQTCGDDCRWGPRVYDVSPGDCPRGSRSCGFPYGNCICTDECICMIDPDCPL